MRQLASPALRAAEPRLNGLDRLVTRWMNGVLFYLDRDVPLVNGHAIYIDSEWSLTSISQKQFWPGVDLARRGDGRVRGILSIDVSEWQRPGRRTGKVAQLLHAARRSSTRCGASSRTTSTAALDGVEVIDRVPRPGDRVPEPDGRREPRAAAGQHGRARGRDRPDAVDRGSRTCSSPPTTCAPTPTSRRWRPPTRRRAGRSTGSSPRRARARRACEVWALREPRAFAAARALDRVRWKLFQRPAKPPLRVVRGGRAAPDRDPRPRAAARAYAAAASALSARRAPPPRSPARARRGRTPRPARPRRRARPTPRRRRAGRPRRGSAAVKS